MLNYIIHPLFYAIAQSGGRVHVVDKSYEGGGRIRVLKINYAKAKNIWEWKK